MEENTRYQSAVKRNTYEVAHALMELKVLRALEAYNEKNSIFVRGESFFNISFRALHNDMIAHAIKLLDKDEKSATFWYLLNKNRQEFENLSLYSQDKINSLEVLTAKLKIIRDKTHFHIDKHGVLDVQKVWEKADIKGKELGDALDYLFSILSELYKVVFNKSFLFIPEDYDETDLPKLLDLAHANKIIEVVPKA